MKKLKIFHWIDGPPDMYIDSGWYWRLEGSDGKVLAMCPWEGFNTMSDARAAAIKIFPGVKVVELGKFNPDDISEYVDGKYAGAL